MVKTQQWRDTLIAINMKTLSPGIEKRITDLLRQHDMTRQCLAFAMDDESAQRFRDADGTLALAASARNPDDFEKAVAATGYQAIWYYDRPTADQIAAAHATDKRVYLSGDCIKTDPDCWTNALRTNANGLCVNHPLQVREHWRRFRHPDQKRQAPAFDPAVIPVPMTGSGLPPAADAPELLAHRGLSKHAPENTLPAFAAAVALGMSIELDVYQTKDNQLVNIHDLTLDRTTDATGKVTDKTLAELQSLDAGSWFDPAFAGQKIPTFEQTLRLIKTHQWRDTVIAINMKTLSPGIEKRIADLLAKLNIADQCFIFEMNPESAQRFRDADPTLDLSISARNPDEFTQALAHPGYKSIWYYGVPTADQIEAAHAADKRVWISGSCIQHDPACWQNANQTYADGICIDHPLDARETWYGEMPN
jgi:glycerophosphoryl diester phosphodiesterase